MKNRDNLHFRWGETLSYNKIWNFVIGQRESGKTVDSWLMIWSAFHYQNRPSIVFRRLIADISSVYIEDIEKVLNKFLETPVQLVYMKGDIKQGILDIRIGEAGVDYSWQAIKKLPVFIRMIALSNPVGRIKSLFLDNTKFMFMDEFILNVRGGEKYLSDEFFRLQEIYTTYKRESSDIRIIAAGNPYSVYCPLFSGLNVDTSKLKPGAFVVGTNYVINCFQVPEELQQIILKNNPMYEFDDSYKRYAFGGEAINDQNIKIQKTEPRGFKMKYVFKLGNAYLSVHKKGSKTKDTIKEKYWCCKHDSDWLSKIGNRRNILVFNFADMMNQAIIPDMNLRLQMREVKEAMNKQDITFNCIDARYMTEDVYAYF